MPDILGSKEARAQTLKEAKKFIPALLTLLALYGLYGYFFPSEETSQKAEIALYEIETVQKFAPNGDRIFERVYVYDLQPLTTEVRDLLEENGFVLSIRGPVIQEEETQAGGIRFEQVLDANIIYTPPLELGDSDDIRLVSPPKQAPGIEDLFGKSEEEYFGERSAKYNLYFGDGTDGIPLATGTMTIPMLPGTSEHYKEVDPTQEVIPTVPN